MNRNENEAESFAGNFVASGEEWLFFERDFPFTENVPKARRGRPPTVKAMSAAERMRRWREQ
jgi:hypothetical protein